jgi:hypothetical protein
MTNITEERQALIVWSTDDIPADGKAHFRQVPGRLLMIDLDDDKRVMNCWPVSVMDPEPQVTG